MCSTIDVPITFLAKIRAAYNYIVTKLVSYVTSCNDVIRSIHMWSLTRSYMCQQY